MLAVSQDGSDTVEETNQHVQELIEKFAPEDELAGLDLQERTAKEAELMTRTLNSLAVIMFMSNLAKVDPSLIAMDAPGATEGDGQVHTIVSNNMRYFNISWEYQYKGEYLTLVLSLPYIQGLVLFFLAWAFPFLAFTLLVPGKHLALLNWFAVWLWVKSWDVGFAVCMIMEDILFALLPNGPSMSDANMYNPGEAFKLVL